MKLGGMSLALLFVFTSVLLLAFCVAIFDELAAIANIHIVALLPASGAFRHIIFDRAHHKLH